MEKEILGSVYYKASEEFMRGLYPIARTVKAEQHDLAVMEKKKRRLGNIYGYGGGNYYRIRKLTSLECWRLMGFSDEDFHKAEEVNSNSQLYKQTGNSIVKNVLMAIFGQMIPGKENLYKEL